MNLVFNNFLKPSKDLTMFFAKIRKENGSLNGIEIQKLKNKLGTRQLPTAELLLDGMDAYRVELNIFNSNIFLYFKIKFYRCPSWAREYLEWLQCLTLLVFTILYGQFPI